MAAWSLASSFRHAGRYRVILYWRPIVPGLNDSEADLERAQELSNDAHATVFTGLFFRDEIRDYFRSVGLPEPYDETARRKILPETLERRILGAFRRSDATHSPLFRKTSCAVCYAHGLSDYNGHYGIRASCVTSAPRGSFDVARRRSSHHRPQQQPRWLRISVGASWRSTNERLLSPG